MDMHSIGTGFCRTKACALMRATLAVVTATLCFFAVTAAADDEAYDEFLGLYNDLLSDHVRKTEKNGTDYMGVDYNAWADDERHAVALSFIQSSRPLQLQAQDEAMAFWINAYNFLTIDLIVREGERESIRNLGGLFSSPWTKYEWRIGEEDYTLDQIEHEILRPMGDPRIHFAINCASVSCPDLRDEPFHSEKLDAQLDEQTEHFFANSGKGLRREGDRVYVSKILDWFSEDFADGDVRAWLREVVGTQDVSSLRYMDYDWSLNTATD